MIEKETLMLLSSQIKERRNEVVEGMARGTDKFEAYQHACGQVRGYDTVQVMISDLISVHEKEEEDFDSSPTDTVISINKKGDK
tara:strand:- start:191 stop:442 length:252 start_codon:yes stop_codon:yes gene_type:complete